MRRDVAGYNEYIRGRSRLRQGGQSEVLANALGLESARDNHLQVEKKEKKKKDKGATRVLLLLLL